MSFRNGIHMYIYTYIHTYIHAYIAWIYNCVTKTAGFGTSYIYTNTHNFYSVKYYKHFTKQRYRSTLHIKI